MPEQLIDSIIEDYLRAQERGETPDITEIIKQHPSISAVLEKRLAALKAIDLGFGKLRGVAGEPRKQNPMPGVGFVLDDFRILSELGRGGHGVVFLATQVSLRRLVAIKMLRLGATDDAVAIARFQREAEAVAKLKHERIANVYAFGKYEDTHYLALEYISGIPLSVLISELRKESAQEISGARAYSALASYMKAVAVENGNQTNISDAPGEIWHRPFIEICCRIAIDISDALQYAHANGMIHRDIKPSNIIVRPDGRATLIDFGLMRDVDNLSMTQGDDFLGTVYYASPEQIDGDARSVSAATDVYSLGATLFELLTFSRPFDGTSITEVAEKISRGKTPRARLLNPRIHPDLEIILQTCLNKEPGIRYKSAAALRDDLDRFLSYQPILAKPPSLATRSIYAIKRKPKEALGAVVITVLVGLLGFLSQRNGESARGIIRERSSGMTKEGSIANNFLMPDVAIEKYTQAIKTDPSNCTPYVERARVYLLQKHDAVSGEKDLVQAQKMTGCDKGHIEGLLSQLSLAKNDLPSSIRLERQIYSKDRRNPDAATRLGTRLASAGKLNEAGAIFSGALLQHPTDYVLNIAMGMLEGKRKDPKSALRYFEQAHKYLPTTASQADKGVVFYSLGKLYWEGGEFEKAISVAREAIRISPNDMNSRQPLIYFLMQRKRFDEAEDELKLAINLDPAAPINHTGLGIVYSSLDKFDKAIGEYEKIVAMGKADEQTYGALAMLSDRMGDVPKATKYWETVLTLNPKNAYAINRLKVLKELGALYQSRDKRKGLLAMIKASAGYIDEAKGVGFTPPKGWIRRDVDVDSEGVIFQDESVSTKAKPNLRFSVDIPQKSPEEYFEGIRKDAAKSEMFDIADVLNSHETVRGRDAYVSRYTIRAGYLTGKITRYDIRVGNIAYIFTCGSPVDLADVTQPLCKASINSAVLNE